MLGLLLSCKAGEKAGPDYGPVALDGVDDHQTAVVGTALPVAPAVVVSNDLGAPVANVVVRFTVASGGGSITGDSALTGADGVARVGTWLLGTTAGTNTLTAVATGLERDPFTLTALGIAGPPTHLLLAAAPPASIRNDLPFTTQPVLQLADQYENPVSQSKVPVTATLIAGGGTLQGTGTIETDGAGLARFTNLKILGSVGAYTLAFNGPLLPTVTANLQLTAGTPVKLALLTPPGSSGRIGVPLTQQPLLVLRDASDNPVPQVGIMVTATIASGGGALAGTTSVSSDPAGLEQFINLAFTGPIGVRTLQFTAPNIAGVSSGPISVTAGPASILSKNAGDNQTTAVGTPVPVDPVVLVTDASGNPVAGIAVSFSVTGGGGSIQAGSANTNAQGKASPGHWTLGAVAGANTLRATAAGLSGSPADFTATGSTVIGPPAQLIRVSGNAQVGVAGSALAESLVVQLVDGNNNGVPGVPVTWSIQAGGGSLAPAAAVTDNNGRLAARWTLGPLAGNNAARATAAGFQANFTATGTAGSATRLSLVSAPSTARSGIVFPIQPSVQLEDQSGNPVAQAGVTVSASIASGGGTLNGTTSVQTDGGGLATFADLAISGTVGPRTLQLSATGLSSATTAPFPLTAGNAATLAKVAGDNQSAVVGTPVAVDPGVRVTDGSGNGVGGVTVDFGVTGGGGSIAAASAVTNPQGFATAGNWTLGPAVGANELTVTSTGLTGSPAIFTANGVSSVGNPAALLIVSGNGQSGTVAAALAESLVVRVVDGNGVGVPGVNVSWSIVSGGGSVSPVAVTSDGNGEAAVEWTLGSAVGAHSVRADAAGFNATFNANATAGAPFRVVIANGPTSGKVGQLLSPQPVLTLEDSLGNAVAQAGIVVTASIASGGGTLNGTLTAPTNGTGTASFTDLVITGAVGARTLRFSAPGLVAATTAAIPIGAGAATTMAKQTGDNQTAPAGSPLPVDVEVLVTDGSGNPVAGVAVNFTVLTGGGTVAIPNAVTDAQGIATPGDWTLGGTAGSNTLRAASTGLSGSPLVFSATGTSGAPTVIAKISGDGQTGPVGAALAESLVVKVTDAQGNPVAGVQVNWNVLTGGGAASPGSSATDAAGLAATAWTLGPSAGGNTLRATFTGLSGSPALFSATGTSNAPTLITKISGDGQSGLVGALLPESLVVKVTDAQGSPVAGAQVNWSILTGGGLVSPISSQTDGSGLAATSWVLGLVAGPGSVRAQLGGLTATFNATILPVSGNTMHPVFSTYIGGDREDQVRDIATDAQGNIYVTGGTESNNFPTTPGVIDRSQNGMYDVYVAKLDPQGQLIWSTFLGGPNYDRAYAIEVDAQGFVYIAGRAGDQFPVTAGAFQTAFQGSPDIPPYGPQDGFVCKLRPDGASLVFCSYFGTDDNRMIRDLDLDPSNNIVIASSSESGSFPASWFNGSYEPNPIGGPDGVIAKISSNGSQVMWATYVGGVRDEAEEPSLRVDNAGNVFALYSTTSDNAPTPGGLFHTLLGARDFYLLKLSGNGKQLLWATFLGGDTDEDVETHELALDELGNPVVASASGSDNYPTTSGAFQPNLAGAGDGVITKISSDGSTLIASTFLGGLLNDKTEGVSVDAQGFIYVTGSTGTPGLPFLSGGYQPDLNGSLNDMMMVKLSPDLSQVLYGTYMGGTSDDLGRSATVTPGGDYIFGGNITSGDFPTINPMQGTYFGQLEGAVVKFSPGP